MISICLISSGFQLLNVYEYSQSYNLDVKYYALFDSEEERIQILNTANFLKIEKIFYIERKKIITYFYLMPFFLKHVDKFIIGHLQDNHMLFLSKILRYNTIILVDDGISTIKDYYNYFDPKAIKIKYPKELFFFSIFELNNNKFFLRNKFEFILKSKKSNSSDVFFIGQPMEKILGEPKYYKVLEEIKKLNPNLTYIAHRRDSSEKLSFISETLGIKILKLTEIIELFLIKSILLPEKIISFYSTSLITIKILFKDQITVNYAVKNNLLSDELLNVFKKFNIKSEI